VAMLPTSMSPVRIAVTTMGWPGPPADPRRALGLIKAAVTSEPQHGIRLGGGGLVVNRVQLERSRRRLGRLYGYGRGCTALERAACGRGAAGGAVVGAWTAAVGVAAAAAEPAERAGGQKHYSADDDPAPNERRFINRFPPTPSWS